MDERMVDTPSAVNEGVPTLFPWGDVVAGNQRAMMIQRAYAEHPERAEQYRKAVVDRAHELGIDVPDGVNRLRSSAYWNLTPASTTLHIGRR